MKIDKEKFQTRSLPAHLEVREATTTEENPKIEGYFSVFGDIYDMGYGLSESVDRHAFDETIAGDVRALVDHDTAKVWDGPPRTLSTSKSMNTASGDPSMSIRTTPTR